MNHCCPNAVKESRSERVGLYRNEQGGFCLPGTSEDNIALRRCHRSHRRYTSIERGQIPANKKEHNQCNAKYDACYDMAI